jgi:hypothetical protein
MDDDVREELRDVSPGAFNLDIFRAAIAGISRNLKRIMQSQQPKE